MDKVNEIAKCKLCEAKNITKLLKVKGGNTKTLKDHLELVHKSKPQAKNPKGRIDNYFGRKSLGETVAKLAIDGIPFRVIAQSEVLQDAFSVSILYTQEYSNFQSIKI